MNIAKLSRRISRLTQNNNHGEAMLEGAKALGCDAIAERVEQINKEQMRLGNLPHPLYVERFGLYTQLMQAAKAALSKDDFKRFHGAF